jgi:hypothetical protein
VKFVADSSEAKEAMRAKFYSQDTDVQLALEELDHTLALLGYQVVVTEVLDNVLKVEIWCVR